MLKPRACLACEKAIISKGDLFSLINIFSKIVIGAPSDAAIPNDLVVPKEWAVFSTWDSDAGDEHRSHVICTQIIYPDGSPFGEIIRRHVKVEARKNVQVAVQVVGFPVGQVGTYLVRSWVEENEKRVADFVEFKIECERNASGPEARSELIEGVLK